VSAPGSAYKNELSDDAFLGGQIQLLQSRTGLRAGLDAVMLAASVPVSEASQAAILDVGTGSGVVGLCVLARAPDCTLTGVDVQPELVALAERNAERNGFAEQARFVPGDVRSIQSTMEHCRLTPNSYDHVVSNPPFFDDGAVRHAPEAAKDRANVMPPGELDTWVRFMTHAARAGGSLTLVHRAAALPEILRSLDGRFGGVRVFPLYPREGVAATRVLVQAYKGTRKPMTLLRGLVLHEHDAAFTPAARAILRDGAALSFDDSRVG